MSLKPKFQLVTYQAIYVLFLFVLFAFKSEQSLQINRKEAEVELKNLSGSTYYKKGVELGFLFQKNKMFDDAIYFYKKVLSKVENQSQTETKAIMSYEIAGSISKGETNAELIKFMASVLLSASENIKDKNYLSNIHEIADKYTTTSKGKEQKIFEKIKDATTQAYNYVANEKRLAAIEASTERVDKEELSTIKNSVTELTTIKDVLSDKMKENEKIFSEMSKENLIKEALLEKQKSHLDSLAYKSLIDSISIQNKNYQLNQTNIALSLQKTENRLLLAVAGLVLVLSGFLFYRFTLTKSHNKDLAKKNDIIAEEKQRSEALLLNILPIKVAEELKEHGKVMAQYYEQATIMFTDFVNFSAITKNQTPQELVNDLDYCFGKFDTIVLHHEVEKIKTIGDAYMCISGVPIPNENHAHSMLAVAFEFLAFLQTWNKERSKHKKIPFDIRVGIHSGAVSAGVVGKTKFVFDIWGDSVNIASRMESSSEEGKINISEDTYHLIKDQYHCTQRGAIQMKNMHEMNMYFVNKKNR